ncbi:MAG TPA: T9SS type A sorting domain-containing protein [Saprospiraceae bacterium]|nr:T9SS type A sorting domain-containing protein [Saprospiraceae bacterium]
MKILFEKFYTFSFFLLLVVGHVHGQISFQKTYGGSENDFGLSVQQTTDGGYILFGETASFGAGQLDFYLIKTNNLGDKLWEKTFGRAKFDLGLCVQQTNDGGYILCGAFSGLGNDSLALIKTDPDGNEIWSKQFRGSVVRDVGRFVQQTADEGFIVVGFNGASPEENVLLLKTDSVGNEEWKKTYERIDAQFGNGVRQTDDGGYIVAGQTNHRTLTGSDVYLMRMDAGGDTIWTKTFGATSAQTGRSICIADDGGFVVLGYDQSRMQDLYLIKTNTSGSEEWSKNYGGDGQDIGYAVQQTTDGGYILSGAKQNVDNQTSDMYAVKTTSSGEIEWENVYPKNVISDATSVQQTTDGGYILLGTTTRINDIGSDSDFYLVKTDALGILTHNIDPKTGILISASPNPFIEFTILKFENQGQEIYSLKLFDAQGRLVRKYEQIASGEIRIERENLIPGLFIFRLEKDHKLVGTGKLIFY